MIIDSRRSFGLFAGFGSSGQVRRLAGSCSAPRSGASASCQTVHDAREGSRIRGFFGIGVGIGIGIEMPELLFDTDSDTDPDTDRAFQPRSSVTPRQLGDTPLEAYLQRSPLTSEPAVANQGGDFREVASSGIPIGWMGSGCADNRVTNNDRNL